MSTAPWRIMPLHAQHAEQVARCHIASWRETYQGLLPDSLLGAFDQRHTAHAWRHALRPPGYSTGATRTDASEAELLGFAHRSDEPRPADHPALILAAGPPAPNQHLRGMYIRSAWHGSGLASRLLESVLDRERACGLWVFQDSARAIAFYRKHGFVADGARRREAFTLAVQIHMVRPAD